ncbi:hypothetical protein [uncultured Psychroserpens sp.]|uniref:hypothetical protein n=1 Tax=uncultured Psychroserpens sp. TaxID=255436 RepID=UPI002619C45A|nr:hypothetical protein [uncultured Psychroserpens sp.]
MKISNHLFRSVMVVLIFVLLSSCDPPHNIFLINTTESEAKISFHFNETFENRLLKDDVTGDSLIVYLKPNETYDMDFGIGTWSDDEVNTLVKSIRSLEIETIDTKSIYKTEKAMRSLFVNNRTGRWWDTEINLEIQ